MFHRVYNNYDYNYDDNDNDNDINAKSSRGVKCVGTYEVNNSSPISEIITNEKTIDIFLSAYVGKRIYNRHSAVQGSLERPKRVRIVGNEILHRGQKFHYICENKKAGKHG